MCNGEIETPLLTVEDAKKRRPSSQGTKPTPVLNTERIRKRKSNWARGMLRKKARKVKIRSRQCQMYRG